MESWTDSASSFLLVTQTFRGMFEDIPGMQGDFQICISVPLKEKTISSGQQKLKESLFLNNKFEFNFARKNSKQKDIHAISETATMSYFEKK